MHGGRKANLGVTGDYIDNLESSLESETMI
jgi:hypothetical protein